MSLLNAAPMGGLMRELAEQSSALPLRKGSAKIAASSYAALVAVMDPRIFIRLTVHDDNGYETILRTADVSLMDFRAGADPDFNASKYNMPFLRVLWPSGKITGHEGRHRAARVAKAGGRNFPVAIFFNSESRYIVTWIEEDMNRWNEPDYQYDEEAIAKEKIFASHAKAEEFLNKLNDENASNTKSIYYSNIELSVEYGSLLRGHPERSKALENWKYSPWEPTDMPPQLIGQFNSDFSVSTTNMRIGKLKR